MNEHLITAEWARKTCNEVIGAKVNEQISRCLKEVETSVKANGMSCIVSLNPENLTIQELKKRGFETSYITDPRDGTGSLTIKW